MGLFSYRVFQSVVKNRMRNVGVETNVGLFAKISRDNLRAHRHTASPFVYSNPIAARS